MVCYNGNNWSMEVAIEVRYVVMYNYFLLQLLRVIMSGVVMQ